MTDDLPITFKESTARKFINYAQAHHDGDTTAAMEDLLFCHKVLTAQLMREARANDKP